MTIDLLDRGLPKHPQMLVTGSPVTKEQALEIIRRTDSFFDFPHGNDREYVRAATEIIRFPKQPDMDHENFPTEWPKYWDATIKWKQDWGYINTQFVNNDWLSSMYICGPHGWCHPDGTIGFAYSIGKHPGIKAVRDDWQLIANAFPFLELEVTLMNKEPGEEDILPVVSMLIRNGQVHLIDPDTQDVHANRTISQPESISEDTVRQCVMLHPSLREHAISLDQIKIWADEFKSKNPHWFESNET